jgi:predicted amidohydrolase YtcJ
MADFVIYHQDMMQVPLMEVPNTEVYRTYVGGELVYE